MEGVIRDKEGTHDDAYRRKGIWKRRNMEIISINILKLLKLVLHELNA